MSLVFKFSHNIWEIRFVKKDLKIVSSPILHPEMKVITAQVFSGGR